MLGLMGPHYDCTADGAALPASCSDRASLHGREQTHKGILLERKRTSAFGLGKKEGSRVFDEGWVCKCTLAWSAFLWWLRACAQIFTRFVLPPTQRLDRQGHEGSAPRPNPATGEKGSANSQPRQGAARAHRRFDVVALPTSSRDGYFGSETAALTLC